MKKGERIGKIALFVVIAVIVGYFLFTAGRVI